MKIQLDSLVLWQIFAGLDHDTMKEFVVALPHLRNDYTIKKVLEHHGSLVITWLKTHSRLVLEVIPTHILRALLRRMAILDERQTVRRLINSRMVSTDWLDYPLKRALRLGLTEQVEWLRSITSAALYQSCVAATSTEAITCTVSHIFAAIGRNEPLERVKDLIQFCASVNDIVGTNIALNYAAVNGRIDVMEALLDCGTDINGEDEHYGSVLTSVIGTKVEQLEPELRLEMVRLLIDMGANISATHGLDGAHGEDSTAELDLLLSAGADVHYLDDQLLRNAASYGYKANTVRTLLQAGANVNARDKRGRTALFKSVEGFPSFRAYDERSRWDPRPVCKLLLDAGADVNARDDSGKTVLIEAADSSHPESNALEFLIESGADVNATTQNGDSALTQASLRGILCKVQTLVRAGADINMQDSDGYTALIAAVIRRQIRIVDFLVDAGADVKIQDNDGQTALMYAEGEGFDEIVKLFTLKQRLKDKSLADDEIALITQTINELLYPDCLIEAAGKGDLKTVEDLLSSGVNINVNYVSTANGFTALIEALPHIDVVKCLIKAGADVNMEYMDEMTPLMKASCGGLLDTVKVLVKAGANVNSRDSEGKGAVSFAAEYLHADVVQFLIEAGADVTEDPALILASGESSNKLKCDKSSRIIKMLLDAGTDVNVRDEFGNTALMMAAAFQRWQHIDILLAAGADIDAVDDNGQSASDIAADPGFRTLLLQTRHRLTE